MQEVNFMKQHIKRWYPKDQRFFRVLSISGNIKNEDAHKLNISDSRLKNMEKDKLIERVSYPSRYNNQMSSNKCYQLTAKGKQFVEQQFQISRCQNGFAIEHNCKVAEVICSLNKDEIDSVRSEWESRDQMEEALEQMRQEGNLDQYDYYMDLYREGKISAPDITYTSSVTQELVCIEITTGSYKEEDIQAKETFSEIVKTEIEYVNVV